MSAARGPLAGLVVVDASSTLPGSQVGQFLADCGADVILVEPPGGSMVRRLPGWPALLRGRRSVTLNLRDESDGGDRDRFRELLAGADVFVHTLRPTTAERMGLTADALAEKYPRLITAHITGWGSDSPWKHYKGWEGLVYAKTGAMWSKRQLTLRPGPAFMSAPYASWGASQAAVHGVLAALLERESSGLGQVVESDLVRGLGALEVYNWFYEMVLHRYPGAYTPMDVAYDDQGRPQAYLIFALLVAATKDGTWLQFAQTAPRLMKAWLEELGLAGELADEKWKGFPMLPTAELREEWWTGMLERVGGRTYAEWQETFLRNRDVSAEAFATPDSSFEHPQTVFEKRVETVPHPELGPVTQASTLVQSAGRPLTELRPAPSAGAENDQLATLIEAARARAATISPAGDGPSTLPLDGVTILEFGVMFAGPYGTTVLTDLGARVIHVETLGGDGIRNLVAFPEAGGAKVMQGKESLAIDLDSADGLAVIHELVKSCHLVVQCFRGDAAVRLGIGEAELKAINPDLVYLNAPGYGTVGPYAGRPAYAPSIDAAAGLSATDGGGVSAPADVAATKLRAASLHAAGSVNCVQADGIAALAVGSGLLLGLYAKRRGVDLPDLTTTMLGSAQQSLIVLNTQYQGRPEYQGVDADFYGLHALYRLYEAADGWIFLAAPFEHEWQALVQALNPYLDLGADPRFTTQESRRAHDKDLIALLSGIFAKRGKVDWENELSAQDVGCVVAAEQNMEWNLQDEEFFAAGYSVDAVSPVFDEHRRLAPITRFSRSRTKADGGCTLGQHTRSILAEIGYDPARIEDLLERSVVGGD